MSHELSKTDWQPTANLNTLKARAKLYGHIRDFFAARDVLEVETPLLAKAGVTDVFIENLTTQLKLANQQVPLYLQSSPEYAMKRLLANGCGSIFEITKAFRQDEIGPFHNPEFSMLEWYRVGFNHHDLMDEVDVFLQTLLNFKPATKLTYETLFLEHVQLNPHTCELADCLDKLNHHQIEIHDPSSLTKDDTLQLLLNHLIEPQLGFEKPVFIYEYPATQAALARIENNRASRFEVYIQGIELANGFHELVDSKEQRQRFEKDLKTREALGLTQPPIDEQLLHALKAGLPDCSGVALGLDRLLMIALNKKSLKEVLPFG